ncbi:hypothetical protein NW762_011123 [Fusarium torreyae]|uniref:ATP adenylyltransferase n=1 Tax=Fusarium torreyae TaxID=1237075 RepID=A0A9W8RS45_9HYPO|nr:hypothetical protein NW762_011123 [Fusarium torreyae]
MSDTSSPEISADSALAKFDDLVKQGRLLYEPSTSEIIHEEGIKLEFRLCRSLKKKPILPRDSEARKGVGGPFLNPDPDFVIAYVNSHHVLELNMFSVYRPQFVLHTKHFAPQTDDLDLTDFAAAWSVMGSLEHKKPQMMIYNCGVNSGSSQGHKHMQVFEKPQPFPLFPESAISTEGMSHMYAYQTQKTRLTGVPEIARNITGVPYQHFVLRLPDKPKPGELYNQYQRLLQASVKEKGSASFGLDYNVAMTKEWLCLIPRRHGRKDNAGANFGANAAGMLGVIWVSSQEERDSWDELGMTRYLAYLGVPLRTGP